MSRTEHGVGLYGGSASDARRRAALENGSVPIAVYGLGKMGLPLAAAFADATGNVVGADTDEQVVRAVTRGDCPVENEPGLPALVRERVEAGDLTATTDPAHAADAATVHVVIVPTTLDQNGSADLEPLGAVTRDIATGLKPGDLVVVESTVPPGTCAEVVHPVLERESGLPKGFGLACCPERSMSGQALSDIRGRYPRIVGGVDAESTRAAALLYDHLTSNEVLTVADATTAEAVKVFEGVYRDVNIALANELARFTDELDIDVNEAIDAANTQPYCDIHTPGAGVGGHCIPVYPQFLTEGLETSAPLLRTARHVNDWMPVFVVRKLREELAREGRELADASVLVLGLTYRPGVAELRNSPGVAIVDHLADRGAEVYAVDPVVEDADIPGTQLPLDAVTEGAFDGVVLATAHREFATIDWTALESPDGRLVVVDGRQALDLERTDHRVYTVGGG